MFQRQTRAPFPARNIVLLVAAALALILLVVNSRRDEKPRAGGEAEEKEEKGPGLAPSEWFYAIRSYPDRSPDIGAYTRALAEARGAAASRSGFPGFTAPWTVEGPGNIGARVNTIELNPANHNIAYIGYSGGGLWKTADGGATWSPVFDNQNFLSIGDIAVSPQNPNTVYVGTGDPNISAYPFIGDGVWKSTNGGATWQSLGLAAQRIVSRLIVHPTNPNTLYAATMGLPFARSDERGLYKTTDGGATWQQVLFVSDQAGIIDLVMSPTNPDVLYAASWDRIRSNAESLVSGPNARIWKTTNGGATWTQLAGGLPVDDKSRISLAIDPQNANRVWASYTSTSLGYDGLYVTQDGGTNWQPVSTNGLDPDFRSNFAWYFGGLVVNPYNANDLWMLGVTTYRSTDGGQNWSQELGWSDDVHVDHHDLAFLSATSFLIATDGGLYKSTDNGFTWTKTENNPVTQFYRVAYNPHAPELYYGGAQDNGTVAGHAPTINSWEHLYGGDGFQAVFHPTDPTIYYYEYQNGAINGATPDGWFQDATTGIDPTDRRHWDMQYMISHHDPDVMYTGTFRVYQGYLHPPTWTPISPDLTDPFTDPADARFHTISTVDESPLDAEAVYVGTTDGNVWRGNAFTQQWDDITAGLPDRYVSSVVASPASAERVFVTHSGYRSNDNTPLIHRSDNRGATWVSIAGDLPGLAINDIVVLPGFQDSVLFVATDGGVWGTLNGGSHWERLGTGMPMVPVYDLRYNPTLNTLIAGTHARSIQSFPLDSLSLDQLSTNAPTASRSPRLFVTPSPASSHATLAIENLSLKKTALVSIIDLSGRVVARFELRGGNRSELPLPVHEWPAGAYVAFAQTDGQVWGQRKFVVLR